MKIGIVYVVYGGNCDIVASHCISYSRKYTRLPITVLTNIEKGRRNNKWANCADIDFIYSDDPTENNRLVKLTMNKKTPYGFTIYLDADSIIQNDGFDEEILKMIEATPDLILNHFCTYPYPGGGFQNIYLRAMRQFECEPPLKVYNGAFIGFRGNGRTERFFNTWLGAWLKFGAQREMPPLACAVSKSPELNIYTLPDNFFSPDAKNENAIVQHNYNADFWDKIGCEPTQLSLTHHEKDDYGFTTI